MKMIYTMWQWSWGFLQTVAGATLYLKYLHKTPHYNFYGACITVWSSKSSVSLGKFIFLSDDPFCFYEKEKETYSFEKFNEMLLVHEYGHTIQSLILGPLYLIVIGAPSMLWSFLPVFAKIREQGVSYFDIYCEKWANKLGEKVTGKESIGYPKVKKM